VSFRNASRGRPPAADAQFGADLGGDGLPIVDTPEVVLARHLLHPALGKPTHRHQLARERSTLSLRWASPISSSSSASSHSSNTHIRLLLPYVIGTHPHR
jgi:hypothetical protein